MTIRLFAISVLTAFTFFGAPAALAAPTLRANVTVVSAIVTVGDMFEDAGVLAEKALFRAPLPGTTGLVSLDAVRQAAQLVGLTGFDSNGVDRVRVGRAATVVDGPMLTALIRRDLEARGIANDGIVVRVDLDSPQVTYNAEAVDAPVQLTSLRYTPGNGNFSARFHIAGSDLPLDMAGRIELMIEAPHLATPKAAGVVLTPADIEMRLVPLKVAEASGVATLDQLVGMQLQRQSRAGLMLRATDVEEPQTVRRNAKVTVVLRSGAMTLTVKGQALNSASTGQAVQVLNSVTKKILYGIATANGAVEMTDTLDVADL